MSRPSRHFTVLLSFAAALSFAGCKTIYSDTYKWKHNHFKPEMEKSKEKDLLLAPPSPGGAPAGDAPPALPAPAGMEAPAMDAAPAPAPPIPGL